MGLRTRTRTWLATLATCTGLGLASAAIAQPANDLVTGAIDLSVNTPVYGTNVGATSTTDGPAPAAACASSSTGAIWYKFTPATTGLYQVTSCGSRFDTVLNVFSTVDLLNPANNAGYTDIGCDDESCSSSIPGRGGTGSGSAAIINSITLNAGTTYFIRLSGWLGGTGATQIAVFDRSANGACCTTAGVCTVVAATSCATSGTGTQYFLGAGTTCTVNPCQGLCCNNTTSACAVTNPGTAAGGCVSGNSWRGFGSGLVCGPTSCPSGACCSGTTGLCTLVGGAAACTGTSSVYQGDGTVCGVTPCATGACCSAPNGTCSITGPAGCTSGIFAAGGTCTAGLCNSPANDLCSAAQTISGTLPVSVTGTTFASSTDPNTVVCVSSSRDVWYSFTATVSANHSFSLCNAVTGTRDTVLSLHTACPVVGNLNYFTGVASSSCNDDGCSGVAGASALGGVAMTAGQTMLIRVAQWSTTSAAGAFRLDISTEPFGACCAAGGCLLRSQSLCASSGGTFIGDGTSCSTAGICSRSCCNATTGACTIVSDPATCLSPAVLGAIGTVCNPNPCGGTCCNPTTGACSVVANAAACASPNTYGGDGSVCSPNPCPPPPAPANDECTAATALTLGTTLSGQSISFATGADIASCTGTDVDVWFSYTPAVTAIYRVTAVPASTTDDALALAFFDACPPGIDTNIATPGACVAQPFAGETTTVFATLNAGTPYFIRAGAFAGDIGIFSIRIEIDLTQACCLAATGACSLSTAAGVCPSGTVAQGTGTTCSPNPCPAPPIPNDDCNFPTVISAAGPFPVTVSANLNPATSDGAGCGVAGGADVYYSFTPAATGFFALTTCDTVTVIDTVLSVHTSCPTNATNLVAGGCDDDSCGTFAGPSTLAAVQLTGGTTYTIRVGRYGPASPLGDGIVTLTINPTSAGACCSGASCSIVTGGAGNCSGTYLGNNTVCTPNPCGGACCSTFGICSLTTAAACASPSTFQGLGTVCTPNPCPQPPAPANDLCADAINLNSVATFPTTNYTQSGQNVTATNDGIEPSGECNADVLIGLDNSVWYRYTPAVDGTLGIGVTTTTSGYDILVVLATGADCASLAEVADPACDGDGAFSGGFDAVSYSRPVVAGTTYWVSVGDWGTFDGGGDINVTITFTPTAPPTVVCCRGSTCSIVAAAACTTTGTQAGASNLAGSTCNAPTNNTTPCCHANYNKIDGVTVPDIFAFLADWFANSPYAFVGGDGTGVGSPGVPAIFAFLGAWFAGCP